MAERAINATPRRLEVSGQQQQNRDDREQQPDAQPGERLLHRRNLPAHGDRHAARRIACPLDCFVDFIGGAAQIGPAMLPMMVIIRCWL